MSSLIGRTCLLESRAHAVITHSKPETLTFLPDRILTAASVAVKDLDSMNTAFASHQISSKTKNMIIKNDSTKKQLAGRFRGACVCFRAVVAVKDKRVRDEERRRLCRHLD